MLRKFTSLMLVVAFAAFMVSPVLAGSGCTKGDAKTTETATQASSADKSGCTAAEKAACAAKGVTCAETATAAGDKKSCTAMSGVTTADAKLPNGHPVISVVDAQKCGESTTAFLTVNKMTCGGCVAQVNKTLGEMDGVCAVDVNLEKASATVVFHTDKVTPEAMIAAISKAGYEASLTETSKIDQAALESCKARCANVGSCTKSTEKTSDI
ncbi:MAG: heavy-metal-associated domain-containing protein [bacterium]